ncbi:MAG: TspO/MBR family protein [bacterium]
MAVKKLERLGWRLQGLVGWILVSYMAPLPALFLSKPYQWYENLAKPGLVPPGGVFSVVWMMLYFFIGVAVYLVWRKTVGFSTTRIPLLFFIVQFLLNAFWTPVFFGMQSPAGGLVMLVLLVIVVTITTRLFWKISRPAGILFAIYLLWIIFALYLNTAIFLMN